MPDWPLGAADFPKCDQETIDDFVPPSDNKREKRPRAPQTVTMCSRCVDNHVKAFSLVYGREHENERTAAKKRFEWEHENNKHEFPCEEVFNIWEELNWAWWEDLKQTLRVFLREMQVEN